MRVTKAGKLGAKNIGAIAIAVAVLLLGVALVTGRLAHSAPAQLLVSNAIVRLAIVPGRPSAGYFTITGGTRPDRLLSVASPVARIEMHQTVMANGAMRMTPVNMVDVPAGGRIEFKPGSYHLMLFGVPAATRPGDELKLTFTFEKAGAVPVTAIARSAADDHHEHH